MSEAILNINKVSKTYKNGFRALGEVSLTIRKGEIFALLGPNGAGKTTLICIICGIVNPSTGSVLVDGYDIIKDYRLSRERIGLVPQELHTDSFETVLNTLKLSRGLFGKPPNPAVIERVLKQLSLWDKRNDKIMTLSGGMKRRLLIAKALSHEPAILFLDEPTAGVDVELRLDMWNLVRELRDSGVTIILTTHYIEEAEEMADRIGVINKGELVVVEEKDTLIKQLGKKQLTLHLQNPLNTLDMLPESMKNFNLQLSEDGTYLHYQFDVQSADTGISQLVRELHQLSIDFKDLQTEESSLEDIFIQLLKERE